MDNIEREVDSYADGRNVELYLEDVLGQLRTLRHTRPSSPEELGMHANRLLELSRTVREVSTAVRRHSAEIRSLRE